MRTHIASIRPALSVCTARPVADTTCVETSAWIFDLEECRSGFEGPAHFAIREAVKTAKHYASRSLYGNGLIPTKDRREIRVMVDGQYVYSTLWGWHYRHHTSPGSNACSTKVDVCSPLNFWPEPAPSSLCRRCFHPTSSHTNGTCAFHGCACEVCPHDWYRGDNCDWCNPLPY